MSTGDLVYSTDVYRGIIFNTISQFNSYTIPTDFYNAVLSTKFDGLAFVGWKVDPYFQVDSNKPLRIEYYRTDNPDDKITVKNLFSGDVYTLTYPISQAYFDEQNAISGAMYFIRSNGTSGGCSLSMVIDR